MQNKANDSFTQLVSKLFSCNLVMICSERSHQLSRHLFEDNFDNVFNHFADIKGLNLTIRDLCGHNAYPLNGLRLRFTDCHTLKNRPNVSQMKKLQFDVISSLSPQLYESCDQPMASSADSLSSMADSSTTQWYLKWKHIFIDSFEMSEHDFIGSSFGCFFVITDQELEQFKDIFASLVTQIKQMPSIRWIQSDFVRYYIVLSEQSLETHISLNTPKAIVYRELQSIYPNSYWLQIHCPSNSGHECNDEIFNDNQTVVRHEAIDVSNHLSESGDPLNACMDSKHTSNKTRHLSSGSDQSLTNSVQSLNLNDLSQRYLSLVKPKKELEGMAAIIESMFKEFITKTLIPWAEKQIKLLGDSIAQRKGFRRSIFSATKSLINNMSSSTVGLKGQSMSQSIIYLSEAPEMQLRKLGDICMCLRMFELAYNSYYSAKKDFQSENAWLHYGSACEASAVASYFTNKFQRHYFEQAINCYVDSCNAMSLATRATILATEACRHLWPNEAANLFIRMTSDDSDLRSALFLEQASLCFMVAGARLRKSAFHYVLAGHRYNRCGLKHYALNCYRRFNCSQWSAASEHVNLTVARLFLNIANTNASLSGSYRAQGLEILRSNANKQLFFQEFIREIKKDLEVMVNNNEKIGSNYHYLDIPFIRSVTFERIDGTVPQKDNNVCFVGEELVLKLCLINPFNIVLHQMKFYSNNACVVSPTITSTLDDDEQIVVFLSVIPQNECQFEIQGLEYKCDDWVDIKCRFSDNLVKSLTFNAIKTLPLIQIDVRFRPPLQTSLTSGPIEVFTNEIIELSLVLTSGRKGWKPSTLSLTTNANIVSNGSDVKSDNKDIEVVFDSVNTFNIQMPSHCGQYGLSLRFIYSEDITQMTRVLVKNVNFDVKECLCLDSCVQNVVSVRNALNSQSLFVKPFIDQTIEIPAKLTAHLLCDGHTIPWSLTDNRFGIIRL